MIPSGNSQWLGRAAMDTDLVARVHRPNGAEVLCYRADRDDIMWWSEYPSMWHDSGQMEYPSILTASMDQLAGYFISLIPNAHQHCKCLKSKPVKWFARHPDDSGPWPMHQFAAAVIGQMLADKYDAKVDHLAFGLWVAPDPLPQVLEQ